MAPTTQNNLAKNKTPAATQQTPSSAQRQPGHAKGAQGYSTPDCVELVKAVRYFLPLGSQEWAKVQERYNSVYASKNNQAIHKPDSIRNKFCVLVNQCKPAHNPHIDPHIRDAKDTQNDGVGAPVAISIANSEDVQDVEMDDLQLSGRNNNQRATNNDDSQSLESNNKNGSGENDEGDGLHFTDPISSSPNDTSQTSSNIKSPDSAVPRHFSAFAPNSRPSNIGPHRNSSWKSSVTNSPMKAPNCVGSQSASSGGTARKPGLDGCIQVYIGCGHLIQTWAHATE
ncbi:hypothetical protein PCANC_08238 [Puccinia coronata f. sp. avenae]|uniref:DUF6818 domain-containing protein n=1 Tax=Puccinia coronata f. sp. avenae TaxID=200324 RepID=A0A2N5T5S0_9BASI|nr:hypothetical protein PCANC_08238 [Puccinia coronata f. sp. avenae]